MKIALVHAKLGLKGGLETRLQNYIQYFTQRGDDVTILCARIDGNVPLPDVHIEVLNVRHIPKPFRPWAFYLKVKKHFEHNDYDFSLSLGRTVGQMAVLAPSNHKVFMNDLGVKSWKLTDFMKMELDKQSYVQSKKVFACSIALKEQLIALYKLSADKVSVLYPPFNDSNFDRSLCSQKLELRQKWDVNATKITFLFVSTGHKRKGLSLLLDLFERLDKERFQLLIIGSPAVKTTLSNVHYKGFQRKLDEWFALADYTIHPAISEAFGQIVTESLHMKTPVLISDRVGAKELVSPKEGLVIKYNDVNAWLRAIENLDQHSFDVSNTFVEDHKLRLQDHMEKMMMSV